MTIQAPDIFYIEGERYCWYMRVSNIVQEDGTPIEFYIGDGVTNITNENKIEFSNGPHLCTGCYRGHADRYTIDDKGLWLTEILLMGCPENPVRVDGKLPVEDDGYYAYKDLRIKMKKTSEVMVLHPPRRYGNGLLDEERKIVVEIRKGKLVKMKPSLKALRMRKALADK